MKHFVPSALLQRAVEIIQFDRDSLVESSTAPPEHDLATLSEDAREGVEEYDTFLRDARAALVGVA